MAALTNRYEDDDASHLPPGMKRVGYDAETERYTFRDGDNLWLGEPGSFYGGRMKRAGRAPDAGPTKSGGDEGDTESSGSESMEDDGPVTPTSANPFHEHARKALSHSSSSYPQDSENEWGVPARFISAASPELPNKPSNDSGLKRRATQLKEVAASTAAVLNVTRGWSRKEEKPDTQEVKQDS